MKIISNKVKNNEKEKFGNIKIQIKLNKSKYLF